MERETGFEPATSTLARSHSTAELLPLVLTFYSTCVIAANHRTRTALPHCPSGAIPNSAMSCSWRSLPSLSSSMDRDPVPLLRPPVAAFGLVCGVTYEAALSPGL